MKNGYRYQTRYEPGKEYAIYSAAGGRGRAPALLDGKPARRRPRVLCPGALEVSRNNRWLAVAEDYLRRQYRIQFLDLGEGAWGRRHPREHLRQPRWANHSKTVSYVRKHPKTLLPYQVYRHELGTIREG